MGMKDRNEGSLMLAQEEIEMPDTVEEVLRVLRVVLSKPFVQSISLNVNQPIQVTWYKDMSDSLSMGEPEDSPDFVLQRVDMEEFDARPSSKETLLDAIMYASMQRLFASHLFIGSQKFFKAWLNIPDVLPLPKIEQYVTFAGIPVVEVAGLPVDAVILMCAEVRDASRTEITKAFRITT